MSRQRSRVSWIVWFALTSALVLLWAWLSPAWSQGITNPITGAMLQARAWTFKKLQTFNLGLTIKKDLRDQTPLGMLTIAGDHHGCSEWPYTLLRPLVNQTGIPATVYVSRGATACSGAQLTNGRLTELVQHANIEIGSHVGGGPTGSSVNAHFLLPGGHGEGRVLTSGSSTINGNGTLFVSGDVTRAIHIPGEHSFPYLITAVTDGRTLTVSPTTTGIFVGDYWIYETESTSTVSTSAGTPSLTCTSGCVWNANDYVQRAGSGLVPLTGSMVLIAGAVENPYFISTINTATSITLNKNVSSTLTNVEYAIFPWFDTVRSYVADGIARMEADSGFSGFVATIGAPRNDGSPIVGPYLRRTLGIESVASDILGNPYHYAGTTDATFVDRITTSAHWGPKAWKNLADSVADSGAWVITNIENLVAADYKIGTASVSTGSDTVTGTGTSWNTASALSGCRAAPTDCWIFWADDPDPMSYRIASIDSETSITLDPNDTSFGSPVDIDSTPASNQSGAYWIANLGAADLTCRNIAVGVCTVTISETLEQAMIYLDANRHRVLASTHLDAVRRFRQLSYGYRDAGQNLFPNPKFRVARLDLLPPRALFTTVTGNNDLAIFGWNLGILGNMNSTTTLSVSDSGVLGFANTGSAGPAIEIAAFVSAPVGAEHYLIAAEMQPPDLGGTVTSFMFRVQPSNQINSNDSMSINEFRLPFAATRYAVGEPRTYAYMTIPNGNPGIYKARFDCTPEPCVVSDVLASRTQFGNAAPDPFVINDASATAGVYTITFPATSQVRPLIWATPLQTNTACMAGVPGRTSVGVTCTDLANTGIDTDFLFGLYDPGNGLRNDWKVILTANCLSTTASNGCRWSAPVLTRGDLYRRD